MDFFRQKNFLVILILILVLTTCIYFVSQNFKILASKKTKINSIQNSVLSVTENKKEIQVSPQPPPPPQKLSHPPEIVNAVYVTGYSAGGKNYLKYLANLFKATEINAVVIDIKGSDGYVTYASGAEDVKKYNLSDKAIPDIDTLVRFFHDQNIYVIGRIAVFEDPRYSKARPELAIYSKIKTIDSAKPILWTDNNGLSWLDPASKDVWNYNVSLAKDALYHGFDEINFDYVRFATDGNMENMGFPIWDGKKAKSEVVKEFFQYLRNQLVNEKISVDLFGLTTVNTDDMGIGQLIKNAFENFDYISPMVYPSHYANGFIGFSNPAEHPYDVIKYSMDSALNKETAYLQNEKENVLKLSEATGSPAATLQNLIPPPNINPVAKFRPWIQDFNMGADYTSDMVKQEIQAIQDSLGKNYSGFMIWNPSNIYTEGAVLKPETK